MSVIDTPAAAATARPSIRPASAAASVPTYLETIGRARVAQNQQRVGSMFKFAGPQAVMLGAEEPPKLPPWTQQAADSVKAPGATTVVAVPGGLTDLDMQNLNDIQLLDAYISAAASLYMYKQNPAGWNLANPTSAADFTQKIANAKFRVITQGLGSVLSLHSSTASSFSKETTSADLHLDFLNGLFSGFGFGTQAMKELDGILTGVANTLRDLKASWSSQSETIDHLVCFHYFDMEDGLGIKVPYIRLFFMHIDQTSWTLSVGKSSVAKFTFHMGYDDNLFAMTNQVAQTRPQLQDYLKQFSNMSLEAMVNLVQPKAINDDRKQ